MLEVLLQRHVYARPLKLKRDPALRDAILFVLDVLVESGSSAAFRIRFCDAGSPEAGYRFCRGTG